MTPPALPNADALTFTMQTSAKITGLSVPTLYRHARAGRLRLIRVGGRTLVPAESLRSLVAADSSHA